ncbi:MAG: NAD(P)H-dependent oxidoreductase [Actinobacteria bacterium]|nr:NAD(P)H-dependent oxidoreductase [Actinomycetota bacterium]
MKIVAVNGSLVSGGNVDALLDHALTEYEERADIEVTGFARGRVGKPPPDAVSFEQVNDLARVSPRVDLEV